MPRGIDVFSRHFAEFKEQYVVIGGTACELLLSEEELDFRATRDIDIVLIVEALTSEFADAFWSFIRNGGYSAWTNKEGKAKFYRFTDPKDINYPFMIEIFARPDSDVDFSFEARSFPYMLMRIFPACQQSF